MTPAMMVTQLSLIIRQRKNAIAFVQRKRKLRPSEKAMWLSDLQMDIEALTTSIELLKRVTPKKDNDNDPTG